MTNNDADPPNRTLDDDIVQIRELVMQHLNQGRDVVAVMHSYGGVVGTTALSGLGAADRKGLACVKALIYMTAFVPLEHEALADIIGGGLPPWLSPNDKGTIDVDDPGDHFYHDLTPEETTRWTSRLVRHPTAAQFNAPKGTKGKAAWRSIPVTYLVCRNDRALPEAVQEMMASRIEKADSGVVVHREYCEASHSPFLSMPDRVVEVVRGVCQRGLDGPLGAH